MIKRLCQQTKYQMQNFTFYYLIFFKEKYNNEYTITIIINFIEFLLTNIFNYFLENLNILFASQIRTLQNLLNILNEF